MDKWTGQYMLKSIFLITLESKEALYGVTANNLAAIQPNIYMGLIGSYIKCRGIPVEYIDETSNLSMDDKINILLKYKPILVGVVCSGANPSSSTMTMVSAIEFFKKFNPVKGQIKTFICGGHPTVLPERTLEETGVDFVIRGEGYETIGNLYMNILSNKHPATLPRAEAEKLFEGIVCKTRNNEIFMTGIPEMVDVNNLPMVIDWYHLNPYKYRAHNWHAFEDIEHRSPYGVIWTSFGCPYNCSFCCINNLFGQRNYRLRNIAGVLKEIDVLVQKYGVKHLKILDELFIIKNKRMDEFIEGLEQRNYNLNMWAYARMDTVNETLLKRLKKVGMNWIAYGMESVSENILTNIHKGYNRDFYDSVIKMTQDAGISICADFIAGLWEDNYDTLQEMYDFAVEKNFEWFNIYPAFAYPGTPMYDEYIREKRIEEPKNWEEYALYGYNCNPLPTKYLTSAQVLKWRDTKFLEYHKRPEYLSMLETKFGIKARQHVEEMTKVSLKRRIIEEENK
jgi:radical SAM superfamily enzyme YgiQ (UPF0313 family)